MFCCLFVGQRFARYNYDTYMVRAGGPTNMSQRPFSARSAAADRRAVLLQQELAHMPHSKTLCDRALSEPGPIVDRVAGAFKVRSVFQSALLEFG
jgi:hypothetical protein